MHPNRLARRTVLWGTILAAGLCITASYGQDPKQPAAPTAQSIRKPEPWWSRSEAWSRSTHKSRMT